MNPQSWRDVAKLVLEKGKTLAPDRFPAPNPAVADSWAEVFEKIGLPWQIWPEAVTWWSMNVDDDRMVTPKALKEAGWVIRDRWEAGREPAKLELLEASRKRRLEANYRELLGNDGGALEAFHDPTAALGSGERSGETTQSWQEMRAELIARNKARREAERQLQAPAYVPEEGA